MSNLQTGNLRPKTALDEAIEIAAARGLSVTAVMAAVETDRPGSVVRSETLVCTSCKRAAEILHAVQDGKVCSTCLCPPAQKCERCA